MTGIRSVFCAAGARSLNKKDYVSSLKGSSSQALQFYYFSHIHFVIYADRPDKFHYLIQNSTKLPCDRILFFCSENPYRPK